MKTKNILHTIQRVEAIGTACSFLLFPLLFLCAQVLHPNLFHSEIIKNGQDWITHFRGREMLHFAHLLEFMCAPLMIIMALHYKRILRDKAPVLGFIGVAMVVIGAFMLLGNKSALCLTISGFDTLSDAELAAMVPGLEVLLGRKGMLAVLWLLPLLPLGWVVLGFALIQTRIIPLWQSLCLTIGALLMANPEIQTITFFASWLLALGFIPYSLCLFRQHHFNGAEKCKKHC